jgi:hypothetical protein
LTGKSQNDIEPLSVHSPLPIEWIELEKKAKIDPKGGEVRLFIHA